MTSTCNWSTRDTCICKYTDLRSEPFASVAISRLPWATVVVEQRATCQGQGAGVLDTPDSRAGSRLYYFTHARHPRALQPNMQSTITRFIGDMKGVVSVVWHTSSRNSWPCIEGCQTCARNIWAIFHAKVPRIQHMIPKRTLHACQVSCVFTRFRFPYVTGMRNETGLWLYYWNIIHTHTMRTHTHTHLLLGTSAFASGFLVLPQNSSKCATENHSEHWVWRWVPMCRGYSLAPPYVSTQKAFLK